jgi:hypothetical protein
MNLNARVRRRRLQPILWLGQEKKGGEKKAVKQASVPNNKYIPEL